MDDVADKAGWPYWNHVGEGLSIPLAFDPGDTSPGNHVKCRFHEFFASAFAKRETAGQELLEVGFERFRRLPYFTKAFGIEVTGIDCSAAGCEQAESILRNAEISGIMVVADVFAPPALTGTKTRYGARPSLLRYP